MGEDEVPVPRPYSCLTAQGTLVLASERAARPRRQRSGRGSRRPKVDLPCPRQTVDVGLR